jgi:hypothetical protein
MATSVDVLFATAFALLPLHHVDGLSLPRCYTEPDSEGLNEVASYYANFRAGVYELSAEP